jgi:methionine sulfoxide reductase heme-binding subunit
MEETALSSGPAPDVTNAARTAVPAGTSGAAAARRRWRVVKRLVFIAALLPAASCGVDALRGALGANPIATVLNRLGWWTLLLLFCSLACTPLRIVLRSSWPMQFRRMLGLIAFGYAAAHFLFYIGVDQLFDVHTILADVAKRKFMAVGFAALCLLAPLVVTSTKGQLRRLGAKRWKRLHRLAYAAAVLGVIHFIWRVKADRREPLIFAAVLLMLFGVRVVDAARRARRAGRRGTPGHGRAVQVTAR